MNARAKELLAASALEAAEIASTELERNEGTTNAMLVTQLEADNSETARAETQATKIKYLEQAVAKTTKDYTAAANQATAFEEAAVAARRAAAEAEHASTLAEAHYSSKAAKNKGLQEEKTEAEARAEKAMEESTRLDRAVAELG